MLTKLNKWWKINKKTKVLIKEIYGEFVLEHLEKNLNSCIINVDIAKLKLVLSENQITTGMLKLIMVIMNTILEFQKRKIKKQLLDLYNKIIMFVIVLILHLWNIDSNKH
jgi:hypothetical protein